MKKKKSTAVIILFVIRVCLWVTALVSTVYWIWFSAKLHADGIFDPHEYATALRPVFYTCVVIAFLSVALSFVLYAVSKKIDQEKGTAK